MRIRVLAPIVLAYAASLTGCSVISKDFGGDVRVDFKVKTDLMTNSINDVFTVNPDDNEDVRNHRDQIDSARVLAIWLRLDDVDPENGAEQIVGQCDVKNTDEPESAYINAVGRW